MTNFLRYAIFFSNNDKLLAKKYGVNFGVKTWISLTVQAQKWSFLKKITASKFSVRNPLFQLFL